MNEFDVQLGFFEKVYYHRLILVHNTIIEQSFKFNCCRWIYVVHYREVHLSVYRMIHDEMPIKHFKNFQFSTNRWHSISRGGHNTGSEFLPVFLIKSLPIEGVHSKISRDWGRM